MIQIRARNNLPLPIRLTVVATNDGRNESDILITIGDKGASLKSFYGVCIDTDLRPNEDWQEIGNLNLEIKHRVSIKGIGD